MAQSFLACDRDQELLLPPSLREWLPEGHFAWFVIDAVAELDLSAFFACRWGCAAWARAGLSASSALAPDRGPLPRHREAVAELAHHREEGADVGGVGAEVREAHAQVGAPIDRGRGEIHPAVLLDRPREPEGVAVDVGHAGRPVTEVDDRERRAPVQLEVRVGL